MEIQELIQLLDELEAVRMDIVKSRDSYLKKFNLKGHSEEHGLIEWHAALSNNLVSQKEIISIIKQKLNK